MDRDVNDHIDMTKAVPDAGTASFSYTENAGGAAHAFSCSAFLFDQPISAHILVPAEGIEVLICGGEKSHIGAVSIIAPDGARTNIQFPGHKDGVIAVKWASALRDAGYCPVAVSAGIHYDNLSKDGIVQVIAVTDFLLAQVLTMLQNR